MQWFQILKGWLFIFAMLGAIYLMALAMERRVWKTPLEDSERSDQTLQIQQTQSQQPSSPNQPLSVAPQESKSEPQTQTNPGTQPKEITETELADPSTPEDMAQETTDQAQLPQALIPPDRSAPVAVDSEEPSNSASPALTLPASEPSGDAATISEPQAHDSEPNVHNSKPNDLFANSEDSPIAEQSTDDQALELVAPKPTADLLPEATTFEDTDALISQPESESPTLKPNPRPPEGPSRIQPYCIPITQVLTPEGRATHIQQQTSMLVWEQVPGTAVSTIASGEVVRIHQSPYTGLTVYQQSDNGDFCIVYGYLGSIQPNVRKGARLACGETFGRASQTPGKPQFGIQLTEIKPGKLWWQGEALSPQEALPQWVPLPPEEQEEAP